MFFSKSIDVYHGVHDNENITKLCTVSSNAFDQKLAVAMLRIAEGLDCSEVATANGDDEHGVLAQSSYDLTGSTLMHVDSNLSMSSQIPRVQSVPTIGIYEFDRSGYD